MKEKRLNLFCGNVWIIRKLRWHKIKHNDPADATVSAAQTKECFQWFEGHVKPSVFRGMRYLQQTNIFSLTPIIRYDFTPNAPRSAAWFHQIHPAASLIAWLSFKSSHLHFPRLFRRGYPPLALPMVFVRLRLRPRSGPPSLALSCPGSPRLFSWGWPGGCRTLVPSSRRSSAAEGTQYREHTTTAKVKLSDGGEMLSSGGNNYLKEGDETEWTAVLSLKPALEGLFSGQSKRIF